MLAYIALVIKAKLQDKHGLSKVEESCIIIVSPRAIYYFTPER